MKCYRLKQQANNKIRQTLIGFLVISTMGALLIGLIAYPLVVFGAETNLFLAFLGICSWTVMLSLLAISFKRWLLENIEEC